MVQPKTRNRIIDALLELAAERSWDEVILEAVAERAGVTLAGLRAAYDGRGAILVDFVRRIDERVLSAIDPAMAEELRRERLSCLRYRNRARFETFPFMPDTSGMLGAACVNWA